MRVRRHGSRSKQTVGPRGKGDVDGLVCRADYERHKAQLEFDLASLVVPEADAVAEAGRLVEDLPTLWTEADAGERRRLLLAVLDAVYVHMREAKAVVSIRPKAAFEAVLIGTYDPSVRV